MKNEKMKHTEQKRPVTREEAETIISVHKNRDWKKGTLICYGVIFVCSVILGMKWGYQIFGAIQAGFLFIILAAWAWITFRMKKISRLIETNRLYVREAVYDGSDIHCNGYF